MADIGNIVVTIKSDDAHLNRGLDKATQNITNFANKGNAGMKSLAIGIGAVTVGLGLAAIAANKFIDGIFNSAKAVGKLYDNTQKLGISVKAFQELDYAASKAGLSTEGLQNTLALLQRNIGAGIGGDKGVNQALKQIGVSLNDLKGLSVDEQFRKIATGLKSIQDPAVKSKLAFELLGRGAKDALGLINSDIQGTVNEFNKLGISLTQQQAAALDTLDETRDKLGKVFDGFVAKVAANVAPAFTQLLDNITTLIAQSGGLETLASAFADNLVGALNLAVSAMLRLNQAWLDFNILLKEAEKRRIDLNVSPGGDQLLRPEQLKQIRENPYDGSEAYSAQSLSTSYVPSIDYAMQTSGIDKQLNSLYTQRNAIAGFGDSKTTNLQSSLPSFADAITKSKTALEDLSGSFKKASNDIKQSAFADLLSKGKGVDEQLQRIAGGVDKNPVAIDEDFDKVASNVLNDLLAGANPNGAKVQSNLGFLDRIANRSGRDGQDHTAQQKALEELYKFANKGSQQVDVNLKVTPTPYAMIEWVNDPKSRKTIFGAVAAEIGAEAAASAQR